MLFINRIYKLFAAMGLIMILSASFITLTVSAKETNGDLSRQELINNIKGRTTSKIAKTFYDDFDGDGSKELFATVGDDIEEPEYLWFSSSKGTFLLKNGSNDAGAFIYPTKKGNGICKVSSKQKLFIVETGGYGSSSISLCFYVKNGKAYKVKKAGEQLTHVAGKDFNVYMSAFDYFSDGMGHTYKAYYLRWTGTGFKEYKAKRISLTALKKYSGAKSILNKVKNAGYTVNTIYLRENNTIQINVRKKENQIYENQNVTLKVKGNTVKTVKLYDDGDYVVQRSYGGVYKASGF